MSQSDEQVQAKISAARRDAEGLKDKIKRKKDDLTDATRKSSGFVHLCQRPSKSFRIR